jgi:hypothetical protein
MVIVTCLVGIGLLVLAGRIRARSGLGPRPSVGRGLRGREATSGSEPPPTVEREIDERREGRED